MKEAPAVAEVQSALGSEVQFIGMAGKAEVPAIEEFINENGVTAFAHVIDDDGSVWSNFNVSTQPAWAFVDDDGSIEIVNGALGAEELTDRLNALIAS